MSQLWKVEAQELRRLTKILQSDRAQLPLIGTQNPGEDPEPPSCITAPSPGRGIQDTSHSTAAQVYFCFL